MVKTIKRAASDLFKNPLFNFIFKNKTFLLFVRVATTALFFYAIYMGFAHPSKENIFTTALFWGLFWPLFIVVTLPTFGRIFCGICPHGFLGKYITMIGLKKKIPGFLANRYIGIFLLVFGWWGVHYAFEGVYRTPLGSAVLFAVMTVIAFIFYFLYKDMAYCKYICPIGTALRAYSKLSFTWFDTYSEACKSCKGFECAKSCPYGLSPFNFQKKNSMQDCTLCMECTHSCEAVRFKTVKPGFSLYKKFKPLRAEIWTYILILASIPISMAFHHGLNRSNIADQFIWNQTAQAVESLIGKTSVDLAGLFTFVYALLFSVAAALLGMTIASKILNRTFKETFETLGYAFAPLFIMSSLGHALEFFIVRNYERIVEGIAWGFGIYIDVEPLASRGERWLQIFDAFKWIGIIWALYILYKRFALIEAQKLKKIIAYPFAASLIIFFVGVTLYRDYVIETYGRKPRAHHQHQTHSHRNKVEAIDIQKAKTIWLQRAYRPARQKNGPPLMRVKAMGGELSNPKCLKGDGEFLLIDYKKEQKRLEKRKKRCLQTSFEVPKSGYYTVYFIAENNGWLKIAKTEYKRFDHSSHTEYDKEKMAPVAPKNIVLDILRLRNENENFYSRLRTSQKVTFLILKNQKPLAGVPVTFQTEFGWQKRSLTDENGKVTFRLIRDYFPPKDKFNKRYREKFIVSVSENIGDKMVTTTYFGAFSPHRNEYESTAYAIMATILILIGVGIVVVLYRKSKADHKEVTFDED